MPDSDQPINDRFVTTQWSIVAQAGNISDDRSQAALQVLCQNYWFPLYAYARRRMAAEKAEDLTQEFFAVLLEKNFLDCRGNDRDRIPWIFKARSALAAGFLSR